MAGAGASTGSFARLFFLLFITLRRALSVWWIRANRWLGGDPPPSSSNVHKVVIVGDGFAEGAGDWVVMGGPAGPARHLLRWVEGIRQRWHMVNRGVTGSTSSMWCPGKPYFDRTFDGPPCEDADIVVIMLGTMDVVMSEVRTGPGDHPKPSLTDMPV
jgi:hypothetical protein